MIIDEVVNIDLAGYLGRNFCTCEEPELEAFNDECQSCLLECYHDYIHGNYTRSQDALKEVENKLKIETKMFIVLTYEPYRVSCTLIRKRKRYEAEGDTDAEALSHSLHKIIKEIK